MMLNMKTRQNICFAILALFLAVASFTGCGKENADDLLDKGQAAFVAKDYETAIKYFTSAAERGNVDAQQNLGSCYYSGTGVKQDYAMAVEWFHKAVAQDHPLAHYSLGICYEWRSNGACR